MDIKAYCRERGCGRIANISKYRNEIYGVIALWIMLFHGANLGKVHLEKASVFLNDILIFGNVGVDIFLFLSGIGCFFSYTKLQNPDQFYKNRFLKIAPAYFVFGGGYWIIFDLCQGKGFTTFLTDLSLYSFWKTGKQDFWFIAFIVVMYAAYPLIYRAFLNKKDIDYHSFFLCLIVIFLLNAYIKNYNSEWYKNLEIALCRIPIFVIGCLAGFYVYYQKEPCQSFYYICFLIGITSPYICKTGGLPGMGGRYTYIVLGVALTVCFAEIFAFISCKWIHSFFGFLGEMSLELYIVHIAFRFQIHKSRFYVEGFFKEWCIVLLFSVVIAYMLHRLSMKIQRYFLVKNKV